MRIAHIAPPWIPVPPKNYGGTENVISNLIEEQVAQGHKVTLFAPGDARTSAKHISFFTHSLFESGIPWHFHMKAFYHLYKSVEYLKKHIHDFDILHTHLSSSSDIYIFPLIAPLRLPYVTTLHSQFPFDYSLEGLPGEADHYYMEWVSQAPLIAISKSARQREQEKFPLHFIDVVYHGVDLKDFPVPRAPDNFFVWIGRLIPDKGAHLAIKAAKKAGVPLILAGIVDPNLPEARKYFREEIEPEIDGQRIQYIGPVSQKQRNDLLNRARGMLNPLLWEEPFGMVMLEAMATGCPVIAFRRGAASEIIPSEKVGFLVKNVREMVERIHCIDAIDRNAVRNYVETYFSARAMAKNYTQAYQKVLGREKSITLTHMPTIEPSGDFEILVP